MRRAHLSLLLLAGLAACGSDDDPKTQHANSCSDELPCQLGYSCLDGACIPDGSRVEDESCSQDQQCDTHLVCLAGACIPGCSPANSRAGCEEGRWCKPRVPADLSLGHCVVAECDPSESRSCPDGGACVAWGMHEGDCMPSCEYTIVGDRFSDTCDSGPTPTLGCHPFGLNQVPVCMDVGGETAPDIGEPGCDPLSEPCRAGAICVRSVCRRLCRPSQAEPCAPGESCVQFGDLPEFHYCRAQ